MRGSILAAIAALPVLLAGCGKVDLPFLPKSRAQLLVGEWSCSAAGLPPGIEKVAMTFEKGDALVIGMKGDMNQGGMSMHIDVDVSGSYKLKDGTLTLRPTEAHLNSMRMNGQPVDYSMFGGKGVIERNMTDSMEKGDFTIRKIDKHTLELDADQGATTCER